MFSPTDEPPKEAFLPKSESPDTVPGARSATEVTSRATGTFAKYSKSTTNCDSLDETSIDDTTAPVTLIRSISPDSKVKSALVRPTELTLSLSCLSIRKPFFFASNE